MGLVQARRPRLVAKYLWNVRLANGSYATLGLERATRHPSSTSDRYHESLGNVTPADAYFGLDGAILSERRKTKEKTMKQRRLINQKRAA